VESALALHKDVVEAAVVGYPHPIKVRVRWGGGGGIWMVMRARALRGLQGEGIYAFITLRKGAHWSTHLRQELVATVRCADVSAHSRSSLSNPPPPRPRSAA
jgi:acetyl-CoA synthetase